MPTYPPPPVSAPVRAAPAAGAPQVRRAVWLRLLHQWHWVSSALCLFGLLFFAVTGITLNHAGAIESRPQVLTRNASLPPALLQALREQAVQRAGSEAALPPAAEHWLAEAFDLRPAGRPAEWAADEVYLALPRPGGDAWLRFDLPAGVAEYELTDRGWIAWLNDLHKGRHTGAAWRLFIDLFALTSVVVSLTGLLILAAHAGSRAAVWPAVGLGVVVPAMLVILFIH
ncbi:MAG TPA: PepSY-associated TM helix domain-containing protein [Pseudothauera hydrothermalis]|nr:hypothetical protein B4966_14135 [Rhodocyclaceae bacterium]HNQ76588.1 PepSY-associated TM helix domain-containing protein [Pseudothauera hydrothermalis]